MFLESRNFFNILNWTHILQWNVFGVHSDGQSSLLNSFVRVKFLSLSKLVMCKGVQTKKSGWRRVRLFTAQNGRLEWVGGGDRDYSCWQTPLPRTPACFGCASFGFSFACTLLVFSFACTNSERLWTVSCRVCMFLRRVTEFATRFKSSWIRPCCNPWKLQWQVAGAPNASVANTFYSGQVQPIFTKHDKKKLVKASKFLQKHDQKPCAHIRVTKSFT